jgi:hypothetical protein
VDSVAGSGQFFAENARPLQIPIVDRIQYDPSRMLASQRLTAESPRQKGGY